MKPALLILFCTSLSFACPSGSTEWRDGVCTADIKPQGVSVDESAKWVSDEEPPRGKNNPWESNATHVMDLKPENPADEHHPKDCPLNCKWDGGVCDCNDTGKRPQ